MNGELPATETGRRRFGGHPAWWTLFALLFAAHAVQCFRCFPSWRSIVDSQPMIQVDHALHLYHGSLGATFLREHGTNWGYDPFFMAGYPRTPFHDPSAGLSDWCQLIAGGGYRPGAYKLGVLFTMLTVPLLIALGSRWMGLAPAGVLAATLLSVWYYWAEFPRVLLDTGLYSFLWGSAWLVATLGAANVWYQRPSLASWLCLTVVTTIAVMVHPTVALMLAVPLAGFYLAVAGQRGWRWHLAGWLGVALVLAANAYWLVPMVRLWHLRRVEYVFMTAGPWFVVQLYWFRPLPLIILLLGVIGLGGWGRAGRRPLLATIGLGIGFLFALTFFGSLCAVTRGLEPRRFEVPLHFLLCPPAGAGLLFLTAALRRDSTPRPLRFGLTVITLLLAVGWSIHRGLFVNSYAAIVHHCPFPVGLQPMMVELVDWLRGHTDNSARILLEDQLRLLESTVPESLHWTPLLPIYVRRQFIGGQYQVAPLLHHHAAFGDFHMGGRPIADYSPAELANFLQRYNIGWVICWSPPARQVFDQFPDAQPIASLPRYTTRPTENRYFIYKLKTIGGFFAEGSGKVVNVDYNRIELADLEPTNGRIVLRYHWLDTLRSVPPLPLEQAVAGDDPVGFIGIRTEKPIKHLLIENRY